MCDRCYQPGACCRELTLNLTFWDDTPIASQWEETRARSVGNENAPFIPVRKQSFGVGEVDGRGYSRWIFSCPWLAPDGRCSGYEERPDVCRIFEPGSDKLCVHFQGAEGTGDGI